MREALDAHSAAVDAAHAQWMEDHGMSPGGTAHLTECPTCGAAVTRDDEWCPICFSTLWW